MSPSRARVLLALLLYGVLIGACFVTLNEWRIRALTVVIVLMFAGRTLFQDQVAPPPPWDREADRGKSEIEDGQDRPM